MKLLFSSWNGTVVDNRGKAPDSWEEVALKLPEDFDEKTRVSGFMGWDGIILREDPENIVTMSRRYISAVQKESCGKCFPCRVGTAVMLNHLEKIVEGEGTEEDLNKLQTLGEDISSTSKCSIGQTGPIPILHALKHFRGEFEKAVKEKKPLSDDVRYEAKWTAPCYAACPTGMDIPAYIEHIKEGNPKASLEVIREASPLASSLGRSCFHPCEVNCRRDNVEEPISICRLKRFAWDWVDQHDIDLPSNPNMHTKKQKVAIVGAGPAGLSAAYYLALNGYQVTIFEALGVPGGMVGVGIPPYRVPKDTMDRETEFVQSLGVEIKYNTRVGKDITVHQMKEQGYEAVLLAYGAHLNKKMGVEGEDQKHEGFLGGVDLLREFILTGEHDIKGKDVLVVGGGNVAMDCARTPIRLGAKSVTVVYRRTKKELPADPHEVEDSDIEGVQWQFLVAPKKIVSENGKVKGLGCQKMELGPPDDSGRRRPVAIEGSDFVIPGDILVQAIGQDPDHGALEGVKDDLKFTSWSSIVADEDTMQTDIPWVFVAGDIYNGPLTVVDSTGNARRAAQSIDQFLRGEKVEITEDQKLDKVFKKLGVYDKKEDVGIKGGWDRVPMPECSMDNRLDDSFTEVQTGYTLQMAIEEASRCMRCYEVGMVALKEKSDG